MTRPSSMLNVPKSIRNEINAKLREHLYHNQIETREWLLLQGYDITKSAFNRYAMALRKNDGNRGKPQLGMIAKDSSPPLLRAKEDILLELGRMRVRELALLDKLRDIVGQEESLQVETSGQ